mmetsp:Transcript_8044/g.16705  ORF Transcript_8044/g.16705 Transcript_8044/m.16705 type:complete len:143 (-) Transcript_8044:922-1350(-)
MFPINTLTLFLLFCAAVSSVEAFTSPRAAKTQSVLEAGRRNFLDAAVSASAGLLIASIPAAAGAEEGKISDDLAMPSEEEQRKADEAAMAERLRRKAELQKQGTRPATFSDSLTKEREKQKGMQMSKEERRDALCETLGRGC